MRCASLAFRQPCPTWATWASGWGRVHVTRAFTSLSLSLTLFLFLFLSTFPCLPPCPCRLNLRLCLQMSSCDVLRSFCMPLPSPTHHILPGASFRMNSALCRCQFRWSCREPCVCLHACAPCVCACMCVCLRVRSNRYEYFCEKIRRCFMP